MKKKLSVLMLLICCLLVLSGCCSHEWYAATCEAPKTCSKCGETEGEALGHTWVDATCAAPKTCSTCHATEGAALGHTWVDATTEAPKTCIACAATEGERIITDPRFTTAATKDLFGKWVATMTAPPELSDLEGFDFSLIMEITLELGNDGTMQMSYAVSNMEEYIAAFNDYMVTYLYEEYEKMGYSKEAVDEMIKNQTAMTVPEFVSATLAEQDLAGTFESILEAMRISGVYYVEGDQFYSGLSWDTEITGEPFTLEEDTLTLTTEVTEFSIDSLMFNRVTE